MQLAGLETVTIETSLLIGCVLGIRHFFGERLHPMVLKSIWGLVVLRMLLPIEVCPQWVNELGIEFSFTEFYSFAKAIVKNVWMLGMVVCLLLFVIRNAIFDMILRSNRELYGKKDGVLVYFVDRKVGSCLVGLLCPRIYISKLAEDSFDWCSWIVRHELCHYHAKDNWYGFLRNLCVVLQWFNPLVWYAAKCSVEDFELACDYQVTKREPIENQLTYGKCLVAMSAKNPSSVMQSVASGTSLSSGSLKKRLHHIGNEKAYSKGLGIVVLVGMILLTGILFIGKDRGGPSLWYQIAKLPYVEERIICYEVESPSEENMELIMDNMQWRNQYLYEPLKIVQIDDSMIGVIFPFFEDYNTLGKDGTADYIAHGDGVVVKTNDKEYVLQIKEEELIHASNEYGQYQLWVSVNHIPVAIQNDTHYDVYIGEKRTYSGTIEDIENSCICILEVSTYDERYDAIQSMTAKNPCELIRR